MMGNSWTLLFGCDAVVVGTGAVRVCRFLHRGNWATGGGPIILRFETLVAYLKNLGILTFEVDATQYQPNTSQHSRPDAAQRMQRAHEAAEHGQWFRSEVEAALAEAEVPDAQWVEHSVVKEEMAQQRTQLLAMIAGKAA